MKPTVNLLLLTLCTLLTYQLYALTVGNGSENYSHASIAPGKPQAEKYASVDAVLPAGPIGQYTAMVKRPLFHESRKPHVKKKEVVKSKPAPIKKPTPRPEALDVFLSAVVLTEDKRFALLTDTKNKATEKVYLGDTVLGWELTDITARTVTLVKDRETQTLMLEIVGSNGQPPTATARKTGTRTKQTATQPGKTKVETVSDE